MDFNDRLSLLPSDILISIISQMPTAWATSTFTLSKRWFSLRKMVQELTLRLFLVPTYTAPTESPYFNFTTDFELVLSHSHHILNDQMLESVLSKFPALKDFRLIGSLFVRNLTIRSKKLKTLGISSCDNLKTLELSTPKLVTFMYDGPDIRYNFDNVPKLVEFFSSAHYFYTLAKYNYLKIRLISTQLVKLHLRLPLPWKAGYDHPRDLFPRVRELRLYADFWPCDPLNILFFFDDVLKMAPNAEYVSMRLFCHQLHAFPGTIVQEFHQDGYGSFHQVRVFELDGYQGCGIEFLIIFRLLSAARYVPDRLVIRVAKRSPNARDEDTMTYSEWEKHLGVVWGLLYDDELGLEPILREKFDVL